LQRQEKDIDTYTIPMHDTAELIGMPISTDSYPESLLLLFHAWITESPKKSREKVARLLSRLGVINAFVVIIAYRVIKIYCYSEMHARWAILSPQAI